MIDRGVDEIGRIQLVCSFVRPEMKKIWQLRKDNIRMERVYIGMGWS